MAKQGSEPVSEAPNLGLAAGLGLPLPPKSRGRVYRLPPVRAVIDGKVPLPSSLPASEIETVVASIQSGRIRVAALIRRGLRWDSGTKLSADPIQLRLGNSTLIPAVVLTPSRKTSSICVNEELRVTVRGPERYHLGIEESGTQVLLSFRHSDPKTVVLMGSPSMSLLMANVWPDAL